MFLLSLEQYTVQQHFYTLQEFFGEKIMGWNEAYSNSEIRTIQQSLMEKENLGAALSSFLTGFRTISEGTPEYDAMRRRGEYPRSGQNWAGSFYNYFSVERFETTSEMNRFVGRMNDVFSPFIKRQFDNMGSREYDRTAFCTAETARSEDVASAMRKVLDVLRCVGSTDKEDASVQAVVAGFNSLSPKCTSTVILGLLHVDSWKGKQGMSPGLHARIVQGLKQSAIAHDEQLWGNVAELYVSARKNLSYDRFSKMHRDIRDAAVLPPVPEFARQALRAVGAVL